MCITNRGQSTNSVVTKAFRDIAAADLGSSLVRGLRHANIHGRVVL